MNYYLRVGDLFLEEVELEEYADTKAVKGLKLSKDLRKLVKSFDEADDIRKYVFIDTGLRLYIEKFRKEER